jgi:hypothetical protein
MVVRSLSGRRRLPGLEPLGLSPAPAPATHRDPVGSSVKPYTDLPGFEALVLEESYVLGFQATRAT